MIVNYPIPWETVSRLAFAILSQRRRYFQEDARTCVAMLYPPLRLQGAEYIPTAGPYLLTVNHYSQPGFRAWWLALAISAVVPGDVHWVVTAAWTFPGRFYRRALTPFSRWLFTRLALVYGFSSMPPMPPDPVDTTARAQAVRKVLAYARQTEKPLIGLAPEGMDSPDGFLQMPPTGVGRFILQLSRLGLEIRPVGAYEQDGIFCLSFGPPYHLEENTGLSPEERDCLVSRTVMQHIAAQLPAHLRGEFVTPLPLSPVYPSTTSAGRKSP